MSRAVERRVGGSIPSSSTINNKSMASKIPRKVDLASSSSKQSRITVADLKWFRNHIMYNKKRTKRAITNAKKHAAREERRKVAEQLNSQEFEID